MTRIILFILSGMLLLASGARANTKILLTECYDNRDPIGEISFYIFDINLNNNKVIEIDILTDRGAKSLTVRPKTQKNEYEIKLANDAYIEAIWIGRVQSDKLDIFLKDKKVTRTVTNYIENKPFVEREFKCKKISYK